MLKLKDLNPLKRGKCDKEPEGGKRQNNTNNNKNKN